jgi:hypothetical protein
MNTDSLAFRNKEIVLPISGRNKEINLRKMTVNGMTEQRDKSLFLLTCPLALPVRD